SLREPAPTKMSPELTATLTPSSTPFDRTTSSLSASTASRSSIAARTARRASSSCSSVSPKNATMASPMNFSTLPPWRSSIAGAAAAVEGRRRHPRVALQDPVHRLRVELLPERGRVDDVREHDGRRPAGADRLGCGGRRRSFDRERLLSRRDALQLRVVAQDL